MRESENSLQAENEAVPGIAVDGHVHLYPEADPGRGLSAGYDNLMHAAEVAGAPNCAAFLLMTETAQDFAFSALASGRISPDGWTVTLVPDDPDALSARRACDGASLTLIAGKQIVTAERLEVLAYGTSRSFDDGRPIEETLTEVLAAGIPACLPWGLGKWMGKRGRQIAAMLETHAASKGLVLGDNAGRPRVWPQPRQIRRAQSLGVPVLPGSDPLPLPGAEADIGRYGAIFWASVDALRPAASMREHLRRPKLDMQPIGKRQTLREVIKWQKAYRQRG